MPLGAALLIAACLGSTDAGATISVLSSVRRLVPDRLKHLLEFESSVNDPTALRLFRLIVGLFSTSQGGLDVDQSTPAAVIIQGLGQFVQQVGAGLILGVLFGYVAKFVIDHLARDKSQLLIVAMSIAFVDYGTTHFLGGSGFIAVYITGLMMSNIRYRQANINHEMIQDVLLPFNTMAEICIFLIFGLLVSWCGLRGAVPLALSYSAVDQIRQLRGINPETVTSLVHNAQSIVFIVVLVNLLAQGLTLPRLCHRLRLMEPSTT